MVIAILLTVHNRKVKTLRCLSSIQKTYTTHKSNIQIDAFLTDDGSTDGTTEAILQENFSFPIHVLKADGTLFWNGGMINSWKAALAIGGFDGFLWLNDDTVVLPEFWQDLLDCHTYCMHTYKKGGIYVGSTKDRRTEDFTYGGFVYTNKLTLKDKFILPDGHSFQECEAAHGNITYVSADVVAKMGIFTEKYHHGGSDHDYTYLAHKAGFPVLVLPHYSGYCENDHLNNDKGIAFRNLSLKERVKRLDLHNTLLFNRRCFPWRYPLVLCTGYLKALFPKTYHKVYLRIRGVSRQ